MNSDQKNINNRTPQIALVGTTRAGKSVFTTVLAKYLERKHEGVRLSPKGGTPKSTYAQIDEWWNTLQTGSWLPATTPGTLIELQWDLCLDDKKIPLRMFDYAGETLTDLFSGKKDNAVGAAKEFFDKVRAVFESASVLLVLINLESFIEKDVSSAGENKGTLVTAMSSFLDKLKLEGRSCRVCFVFTAYDQYKPLILSKWGSVEEFLEREIPPLYYEFVDEKSDVKVLPVAAVGETETRVDSINGITVRFPKPGFKTVGFDPLVKWIVEAIEKTKNELDSKTIEQDQDERNSNFIATLAESWERVSCSNQIIQVDQFLSIAKEGLPYPQRPNTDDLILQQNRYVDEAVSLRSAIFEYQSQQSKSFFSKLPWGNIIGMVLGIAIGAIWYYDNWTRNREKLFQGIKEFKAEHLKHPRPEQTAAPTWEYTCKKNIFGCSEHCATITVPLKNAGAAGNITVSFTLGGKKSSIKRFFNAGESSDVTLTITNLPNHTSKDSTYGIEVSK